MPVTAPDLKEISSPSASDFVAACAVRTLARTETFMPMKPAAPDRTAPIRKPSATFQTEQQADHDEDHDTDGADRGVLPLEIGLRALRDRACDLLHARTSRIPGHDRFHRDDAVSDGDEASQDDQRQSHKVFSRR